MRVSTAFDKLLRLQGISVTGVTFGAGKRTTESRGDPDIWTLPIGIDLVATGCSGPALKPSIFSNASGVATN